MDIDVLMSKDSSEYRFHGVKAATLYQLVQQSKGGEITLWGRVEGEDGYASYARGEGELSATEWKNVEMSCNEFVDDGGLVLVLEALVDEPSEEEHPTDRREVWLKCEEWRVIGGLRPVFDEDQEIVEFEALSLEEIAEEVN